jgi:hypothetical protein
LLESSSGEGLVVRPTALISSKYCKDGIEKGEGVSNKQVPQQTHC